MRRTASWNSWCSTGARSASRTSLRSATPTWCTTVAGGRRSGMRSMPRSRARAHPAPASTSDRRTPGRWWTPERDALDAAVASTQKRVTGAVRLKLFKGGLTVAGRESPYALYQPSYATFGKDNVYDQKDAEGFIHLYGLSIRIWSGLDA